MKSTSVFFLAIILLFTIACRQPKPPVIPTQSTGNVTIQFVNQAGGADIVQGQLAYTNASGNKYSVDLLKYYISNVILVKDDGTEFKLNNYDLMNAFDTSYATVLALNVPNGNYQSMKFMLGIDSARNQTEAQEGDLDPSNNMSWNWNTGYIFFKHEGTYKNAADSNKVLQFHLGRDIALAKLQIPIALIVSGTTKKMNILFDLNKMYDSPLINFNTDDIRMSTAAADSTWIRNMVANTQNAFTFNNVE